MPLRSGARLSAGEGSLANLRFSEKSTHPPKPKTLIKASKSRKKTNNGQTVSTTGVTNPGTRMSARVAGRKFVPPPSLAEKLLDIDGIEDGSPCQALIHNGLAQRASNRGRRLSSGAGGRNSESSSPSPPAAPNLPKGDVGALKIC